MLGLVLAATMQVGITLPNGYEGISWGTTIEELTSQFEVHKATPGSEYSYADHTEVNPEVYVRVTEDNIKIEYYFFEGKLYKIYIVYDRAKSSAAFYQEIINKAQKRYGPAQSHYQLVAFKSTEFVNRRVRPS